MIRARWFSTFFALLISVVLSTFAGAETAYELIAKERLSAPNSKDILSTEIKAKIKEKLERRLSATLNVVPTRIAVDGYQLQPAYTVDQLIARVQEVLVRIEFAKEPIVELKIDGEKFRIQRKALGEGLTGIVFRVVDSPWVIKLASPDVVGLNAMMDEGFILPHVEALKHAGILVAQPMGIHPAGVFAVKIAAPPNNMTQMLLVSGLLKISDGVVTRATTDEMRQILKINPPMRDIAQLVMKMTTARRQFSTLNIDLGPDNLHITQDTHGSRHLILVDTGRSGNTTKATLDSIKTFDEYLSFAESMVKRYVATGVMKMPQGSKIQRTCDSLFVTTY